ncbi:TIGR02281 family clan AA aspartic protease [Tianweitania sediminis]|uniref:TIGR02281 family clan AA aspartic protease n=1 Tax=Tianweitania sediminis TaxID=1502156 RepID=A0A8J7R8M3_9HYPH|nr:TIGR02281 family clan AA aspartic protease [Tianweitania sediminis]MBP0441130.1 TIGR02281 family clan AA aspartic protease [Tianweitania sediminis]HEV7415119.1 TIGR02281 family clan AA aspartic protease [Tianweitania sediminis]
MSMKLVLVSTFVGVAASVPLLYQSNPEFFASFFDRSAKEVEPVIAAAAPKVVIVEKTPEEMLQGRKVRVEADERGHFAADFRLNGRSTEAMIDTGATLVAINESTARRIGLSLKPSDFSYRVQTANGMARAAAAVIREIQIGKIHVKDVQAAVLEDKALSGTLVGMSFLQKITRYRVEAGGMVLEQ